MFADPQAYLLVLLVSVALYWIIPSSLPKLRAFVLIIISAVFLFTVSPLALLALGVITLTAIITLRLTLQKGSARIAWLGVLAIVVEFFIFQYYNARSANIVVTFLVVYGMSYVAFRSIAAMLDWKLYKRRPERAPSALDFTLLNTFFPIVPSGPIEKLDRLRVSALGRKAEPGLIGYGVLRLFVGLFMVSFVGDRIILANLTPMQEIYYGEGAGVSILGTWWFCILSLLYLYANFSGFMSIAIGSGALFNLKISENFNWPFMSTNIQDFWKRWHVTLGEFANRYMYFPMLKVFKGNPYISIFITFVLVGVWHAINMQFLLWGVFHGIALALYAFLSRKIFSPDMGAGSVRLVRAFGWLATMLFVCWAWTFAASPTIEGSWRMTGRLFGLG